MEGLNIASVLHEEINTTYNPTRLRLDSHNDDNTWDRAADEPSPRIVQQQRSLISSLDLCNTELKLK